MSSRIGLLAVILGCFGTAWAAARQQVGVLVTAQHLAQSGAQRFSVLR
ncbi:hypothetical protein GIW45_11325 [Pseudomonas congelans]|nr:hypothetical protein [Pseudomonas congelans]